MEFHILLRHDLDEERGRTLLSQLVTEIREDGRDRALPCSELHSKVHFERASVTRDNIRAALERTFGKDQLEDPRDLYSSFRQTMGACALIHLRHASLN